MAKRSQTEQSETNKQSETKAYPTKRKPKWALRLINGLYIFGGIIATTLFVLVVATAVIPTLGMWLHSQLFELLADQQLGLVGMVGMWFMPLAFLVLLLGLGCAKAIKEFWIWLTNRTKRLWVTNESDIKETVTK